MQKVFTSNNYPEFELFHFWS